MVHKGCGSGGAALARPGGGLASLTLANRVGALRLKGRETIYNAASPLMNLMPPV